MIHKAIDQLVKMRCTEYVGANADALRNMDMDELERILHGVRDQEDQASHWADKVKADVFELEEKIAEHETIRDILSEIKTANANVKRHFD